MRERGRTVDERRAYIRSITDASPPLRAVLSSVEKNLTQEEPPYRLSVTAFVIDDTRHTGEFVTHVVISHSPSSAVDRVREAYSNKRVLIQKVTSLRAKT